MSLGQKRTSSIHAGHGFWIGNMSEMDDEPDPDLLAHIGWKAGQYDFSFHEAAVCPAGTENSTSSWVEVAYCRQLGGAFVVWRSGVSGLEAPRSISYGWVESEQLNDLAAAIERKAAVHGPPLSGRRFDVSAFYRNFGYDDAARGNQ